MAHDMCVAMSALHKQIVKHGPSRRGKHKNPSRRKPKRKANFHVGDYVMYATRHKGSQKKSKPCWTGPYRIIRVISDWDFEIEHLVTARRCFAHACRLDFYADAALQVTPDLKHQVQHDEAKMAYKVQALIGHKHDDGA